MIEIKKEGGQAFARVSDIEKASGKRAFGQQITKRSPELEAFCKKIGRFHFLNVTTESILKLSAEMNRIGIASDTISVISETMRLEVIDEPTKKGAKTPKANIVTLPIEEAGIENCGSISLDFTSEDEEKEAEELASEDDVTEPFITAAKAEPQPKENKIVRFLNSPAFVFAILTAGCAFLAFAVTSPAIQDLGVGKFWSHVGGLFIDFSVMVFIAHKRHTMGIWFALAATIQCLIAFDFFSFLNEMPHLSLNVDVFTKSLKGAVIGISAGLAVFGFSDLFLSTSLGKKE